jgi:hypothetical protein
MRSEPMSDENVAFDIEHGFPTYVSALRRADAVLALAATPTPPAETGGWQPIETAPNDGSEILLGHAPTGCRAIGKWVVESNTWAIGNDDSSPETNYLIIFEPTHWQPLPAPPLPASSPVLEKKP